MVEFPSLKFADFEVGANSNDQQPNKDQIQDQKKPTRSRQGRLIICDLAGSSAETLEAVTPGLFEFVVHATEAVVAAEFPVSFADGTLHWAPENALDFQKIAAIVFNDTLVLKF
mmetsp:Transcript_24929/g.49046  ORF Transcript_24929/g.49046 Transcript_24929/m.49046 type:complete len:114 (+) Transcript_24929:369-710(+)